MLFMVAFLISNSMEDLGLFPPKNSSVFLGNMSARRSLKTSSTRLKKTMSSVEISLESRKHVGFQYQALSPDYPQTAN